MPSKWAYVKMMDKAKVDLFLICYMACALTFYNQYFYFLDFVFDGY